MTEQQCCITTDLRNNCTLLSLILDVIRYRPSRLGNTNHSRNAELHFVSYDNAPIDAFGPRIGLFKQ